MMDVDRDKSETDIGRPDASTPGKNKRTLRYYFAPVVFTVLGSSAVLAYLYNGFAGLKIVGIVSGVVLMLGFFYEWDREMSWWLDDEEW